MMKKMVLLTLLYGTLITIVDVSCAAPGESENEIATIQHEIAKAIEQEAFIDSASMRAAINNAITKNQQAALQTIDRMLHRAEVHLVNQRNTFTLSDKSLALAHDVTTLSGSIAGTTNTISALLAATGVGVVTLQLWLAYLGTLYPSLSDILKYTATTDVQGARSFMDWLRIITLTAGVSYATTVLLEGLDVAIHEKAMSRNMLEQNIAALQNLHDYLNHQKMVKQDEIIS